MSSLSSKNHNPGNLRFSPFTNNCGAVNDGKNYAKFETTIQGLSCMVRLLASQNYRNLSIADAIKRYAPAADNNRPREYAAYVSHRAGVPVDMPLAEMDPFQLLRVVEAMIRFEGWKQ